MKRIRIDYYTYRLQSGKADIFLQIDSLNNEYSLPCRYVEEDQRIAGYIRAHQIEDDDNGDLVINDCTLNDFHIKKRHEGWIPLDRVLQLDFPGNKYYHIHKNILTFFLMLCPRESDLELRRRVDEMIETVKVNAAKTKYIDRLQEALERKHWVVPDASYTLTNPELLKTEIETLEHFRLLKPKDISEDAGDGSLSDSGDYSYEPIDWEDLGFEHKGFMFRRSADLPPIFDGLEDEWDEYDKNREG